MGLPRGRKRRCVLFGRVEKPSKRHVSFQI